MRALCLCPDGQWRKTWHTQTLRPHLCPHARPYLRQCPGNSWLVPHRVRSRSTAARRTDTSALVTMETCGDSFADLTVDAGAALLVYVNCTLAANGAYSSSAGATTFASGSYLIFDRVTAAAQPLYMGGFSPASDLRVEVVSADAAVPLSVTLATYAASGSCAAAFANSSIDGCPSGAACALAGAEDGTNSSQCVITYSQAASGEDSDQGLYGLLGLLALPAVAVLVLALRLGLPGSPAPDAGLYDEWGMAEEAYPEGAWAGVPTPAGALEEGGPAEDQWVGVPTPAVVVAEEGPSGVMWAGVPTPASPYYFS